MNGPLVVGRISTRCARYRTRACQTSRVTCVLKAGDVGDEYVLITAFIGAPAVPEPWDRNATAKSREFWDSHALVWGSEPTIPGTETSVCPW